VLGSVAKTLMDIKIIFYLFVCLFLGNSKGCREGTLALRKHQGILSNVMVMPRGLGKGCWVVLKKHQGMLGKKYFLNVTMQETSKTIGYVKAALRRHWQCWVALTDAKEVLSTIT
jgi:hypothetical protein